MDEDEVILTGKKKKMFEKNLKKQKLEAAAKDWKMEGGPFKTLK